MAGLVVPLGLAFGRMGCVLAGCCFGTPHDSPLALVFPPGSAASDAQFRAHLLESPYLSSSICINLAGNTLSRSTKKALRDRWPRVFGV